MTGRVAVTGSIATDHLMRFPGRFVDHLVAGQLDEVSLSFLVDELTVRRGGVAANIAYGLGSLGLPSVLVGAVGPDFDDYRSWLEARRIDTRSVHVSESRHTARFVCTTDRAHNQIATFYAGAMVEAREIDLRAVAARVGAPDLVVIGPNEPAAMLRHANECRELGYAFAADVSQQLATLTGDQVRLLVDGALYLFTNAYEAALLVRSTRWRHDEVLAHVGWWIVTHGADGVTVERAGDRAIEVPAVASSAPVDPTGVGDAFRAGFLWGRAHRLSVERSAQAGCALATVVLETSGAQEYSLEHEVFTDRVGRAYGADAAGEIASRLRREDTASLPVTDPRTKAKALYEARRTRVPIPPFTDAEPWLDLADGYAVQQELVALLLADGDDVLGYKVGLTSVPMQKMIGVDSPDYGPVLASTLYQDGDVVPLEKFIAPRIEAEIVFVLGSRLAGPGVTVTEARAAIAGAVAGLEIVDSRVVDWRVKLADTVADLASNGAVATSGRVVPLDGIDPRLVGMVLTRNGEVVDSGAGAAALGDPIAVVAWLANVLAGNGIALEPGHLVMTGALHAAIPMNPGDVFLAEFDRLGPVTIQASG